MKKIISTVICLGAMILAFTSCDDETEYKVLDTPVVTLSPASVTLSAEAVESYTINYTVSNPGEGESVSCTADVDWITGFVDDGEGTVTFTVAENTGEELRTATITADYDGITDSVSVTQDYDAGEISLVGTYTVTGDDYNGVGTWIMTIHEVTTTSGGGTTTTAWYADGLTPTDEGFYVDYGYSYCAKITWTEGEGTFSIASQITNLRSSTYYMGWTPCTAYEDGSYYYSSQYPDLTFTMKNSITWESDYGVFLGAWTSTSLSRAEFSGYYDVVAPTMVITKISSDPDLDTSSLKQASASNAARPIDKLDVHVNSMAK